MATNPPSGDNHRKGAVRKRSQLQHDDETWVKRDSESGEFIDQKSASEKFKGVRKEDSENVGTEK